jgi:type IV pilus assembly protein PilW
MTYPSSAHSRPKAWRSRGVTMVELMVAMVLMGLVTLASVSLYSVTSQSYKTVDSAQELSDNARFAFDVIGQALRNAGYQDYLPNNPDTPKLAGKAYPAVCTTPPCPVIGYNNARVSSAALWNFGAHNNGPVNASDTLGVTFFGSGVPSDPTVTADGTVVDCQGRAQPSPMDASDLGISLFEVAVVEGEPELRCHSRSGGTRTPQPIVRGMETFQVVYGVDTNGDSVSDRWLSAQDVTNWMNVRAVRVGFVLRGAPGSSQVMQAGTFYPLGQEFIGSSTETGFIFTPAAADTRFRRAFSATYMLRNSN